MNEQDADFQNVRIYGSGKVLLRVKTSASKWGFYLTDGESVWDGGFRIADNHLIFPTRTRSKKINAIKDQIKSGLLVPNFSRYCFNRS